MSKMTIAKLRKAIDGIDGKLINLLNKRTDYAIAIGKLKKKTGEPIFMPA